MPIDLAIRAREAANDQGMTRASFIRQAMRRNLETYTLHERDLLSHAHAFRTAGVDLSRFCAAPLITYRAAKEMSHEHRQDG